MILNKKETDFIERLKFHYEEVLNREYFSLEKFVDDQKVMDTLFKDSMNLKKEINIFLKNVCNKEYIYTSNTRVKSDIVMLTTVFMDYKSDVENKISYLFVSNFNEAAEKVQEKLMNDCKTFSDIREKMLIVKI